MLHLVTAPAYEPLSLAEAKLFLKVETTADDPLISSMIRVAREYAEKFTQTALVQQTWDDKRDGVRADECGLIVLEKPPVQSVVITYVDTNGDTQTWSSAEYRTDLPSDFHKARIEPAYGYSYPQVRDVINSFTIRQVCGYTGASKSISSITRSSQTATVTTAAAHGYTTGQRVAVSGVDQAEYNGTFEITVTGAAAFTYTVSGTPTTPATGAIVVASCGVPEAVLAAMKLLIAHWYENRTAVNIGNIVNEVPLTVNALLWPCRAY